MYFPFWLPLCVLYETLIFFGLWIFGQYCFFQCVSDIHIPLGAGENQSSLAQLGQAVGKTLAKIDEDDAEFYRKGLPVVAFR